MPVASPGFDDADYDQFQKQVLSRTGIRLIDYKSEQMRRRIAMISTTAGCSSFMGLYKAMETNSKLFEEFLDKMTINVTELLRNPERFNDLETKVLPEMVALRGGNSASLHIWSAGCSYGAEAYTMAMLMSELSCAGNHRIKGTDIDLAVLARANSAAFSEADMNNITL